MAHLDGLHLDGLTLHLGLFKGTEQPLPDVHVHIHSARDRLADRLTHLAVRHAEDATNGH